MVRKKLFKMVLEKNINELLKYGLDKNLITVHDIDFIANQLADLFQLESIEIDLVVEIRELHEILNDLVTYAIVKEWIESDIDSKDLFDTRIMNFFIDKPSVIVKEFSTLYKEDPKKATNYFYQLSNDSNYIRKNRIDQNVSFKSETTYGEIDITINLSKPEKDPKMIAKMKNVVSSNYPQCLLCKENVGYAGTIKHPARHNHRIVPLTINQEAWNLQYSPYVYYNEHCIVFHNEHVPMKLGKATFVKLLDFVDVFPHYFVGSNADLPIVGGSILSHDHFQGGNYTFAMDSAKSIYDFTIKGTTIKGSFLHWPLSVLRLQSKNREELIETLNRMYESWKNYNDSEFTIQSHSGDVEHNTITPIVRMNKGIYEVDVVLRNNRTSAEYPDGIFHPHEQYHHLKKENIGLIEVMGLAVLPGRLKQELDLCKEVLLSREIESCKALSIEKHQDWLETLLQKYSEINEENIQTLVEQEIGIRFAEILACCGVYPPNEKGIEGIKKFIAQI